MAVLDKETIHTIYEKATDILATVGVEFESDAALALFKTNGASVKGKRVFIPQSLLTSALDSLPRVKYNPIHKNSDVYTSAKKAIRLIKEIRGDDTDFISIAPYYMTHVEEIWCYPGAMAAFAGGSFNKMILDEELMINCNRTLQGLNLSFDPMLKEKLVASLGTKSFLTIGSPAIYRKEQRVSYIFDKKGLDPANLSTNIPVDENISREMEKRCKAYVLPERSTTQINQLQKYLPSQCKY